MKRGKPLQRKSRLKQKKRKQRRWRPSETGREFWKGVRRALWKARGPICEHCGRKLVQNRFAAAHVHGLGRGRSRYDPKSQCSQCLVLLNSLENLRVVCCTGPCNDAVALPCAHFSELRHAQQSTPES